MEYSNNIKEKEIKRVYVIEYLIKFNTGEDNRIMFYTKEQRDDFIKEYLRLKKK